VAFLLFANPINAARSPTSSNSGFSDVPVTTIWSISWRICGIAS